jgi:hypothetical protein
VDRCREGDDELLHRHVIPAGGAICNCVIPLPPSLPVNWNHLLSDPYERAC